jgi:aryl-alcohol dehydrogenase-like predicted oxidoreductase
MRRRRLGGSGIEVSSVILGCGSFGGVGSAPELFGQGESEAEAHALMDAAWDAGITCFDTADAYGGGRSERAIGTWLASRGRPVTLATKVFHSVEGDPADHGLQPARIRRQIQGSLRRLGVSRLDLYLIHEPDPRTPVEDTLEALDGLVREGTVGAIGACNVDVAYLRHALEVSRRRGLARFEWVQNEYNLIHRTEAEAVLAVCAEEGLGFTPFSPLCGGWLTGKYRPGAAPPAGSRMTLRPEPYEHLRTPATFRALDALSNAAEERGVEMAALALAWVLEHPGVTAAVVGPRRPAHLEPAIDAVELRLTADERARLAALFDGD